MKNNPEDKGVNSWVHTNRTHADFLFIRLIIVIILMIFFIMFPASFCSSHWVQSCALGISIFRLEFFVEAFERFLLNAEGMWLDHKAFAQNCFSGSVIAWLLSGGRWGFVCLCVGFLAAPPGFQTIGLSGSKLMLVLDHS